MVNRLFLDTILTLNRENHEKSRSHHLQVEVLMGCDTI